jgi:hypothetical protein
MLGERGLGLVVHFPSGCVAKINTVTVTVTVNLQPCCGRAYSLNNRLGMAQVPAGYDRRSSQCLRRALLQVATVDAVVILKP